MKGREATGHDDGDAGGVGAGVDAHEEGVEFGNLVDDTALLHDDAVHERNTLARETKRQACWGRRLSLDHRDVRT